MDVVGAAVRVLSKNRCSTHPDGAWKEYLSLERATGNEVSLERAEDEDLIRFEKLLQTSLEITGLEGEPGVSKRRFKFLSILQMQQQLPESVMKRLWGDRHYEKSINNSERFRIIRVDRRGDKVLWIGMHDLILDFARKWAKASNFISKSSRTLLDTYEEETEPEFLLRNSFFAVADRASAADVESLSSGFSREMRQKKRKVHSPVVDRAVDVGSSSMGYFSKRQWIGRSSHSTVAGSAADVVSTCAGASRKWWLVADDGYIRENMVWLLFTADLEEEVTWLISRPDWIVSALRHM